MNIHTQRLTLSELSLADLDNIHELHCDPLVERYNTIGIPSYKGETQDLIQPVIDDQKKSVRSVYGWAIKLSATDRFIGEAGMSVMNNRYELASIHYHIIPELWGNGYATEVAKALISFAFDTLDLHRVEAGAAVDNIGSHRVLEKAGMTQEGRRRKILPIRGEWHDNYTYAILDTDPRP